MPSLSLRSASSFAAAAGFLRRRQGLKGWYVRRRSADQASSSQPQEEQVAYSLLMACRGGYPSILMAPTYLPRVIKHSIEHY